MWALRARCLHFLKVSSVTADAEGGGSPACHVTDSGGASGSPTGGESSEPLVEDPDRRRRFTTLVDGAPAFGTESIPVTVSNMENPIAVDLYVDNVLVNTDSNGANGWTLSWNTASAATGNNTLRAVARDSADAPVSSANFTAVVDTTIPSLYRLKADADRGVVSAQ